MTTTEMAEAIEFEPLRTYAMETGWMDAIRLGEAIPDYMRAGLVRFILLGRLPGSFLTALLSNDLRETYRRADDQNAQAIRAYMIFLANVAPVGCYGSPARVQAWHEQGGLVGISNKGAA